MEFASSPSMEETVSPESIAACLSALKSYVASLATPLLQLPQSVVASNGFGVFADSPETNEALTRFIGTPEVSVIFIGFDSNTETFTISEDARALAASSTGAMVTAFAVSKQSNNSQSSSAGTVLSLESGPIHTQVCVSSLPVSAANAAVAADASLKYIPVLQTFTRSLYIPLLSMVARDVQQTATSSANATTQLDSLSSLQKKARELESLLDVCVAGAVIPGAVLSVDEVVANSARSTNATALKGLLEKWNVTQVDALLGEVGLLPLMSTVEKREEFGNHINVSAKTWPGEIEKQTRLLESAFQQVSAASVGGVSGAERELQFWREMEKKLMETKELLESAPVLLTKIILRRANRVSEQRLKESEAKLDQALETVNNSLAFLRDLPIDDVFTATDLHPQLSKAMTAAMGHIGKLRHSKYDLQRAVSLFEAISSSVLAKCTQLLRTPNLLQCSFADFVAVFSNAEELFTQWETQIAAQKQNLKTVGRLRNTVPRNIQLDHEPLRVRLQQVHAFREQHEKLVGVFTAVLANAHSHAGADTSEAGLLNQLQEAYASVVRNVNDILDTTPAGTSLWASAQQQYEKQVERIESKMTRLLEERLTAAASADEMFRVFSTFNPLFFRPAIKNAVNSFRSTLLKNVQSDVRRLQEKFKLRYDESCDRITSDLHDIPPLSGRIIWARQIESQLSGVMKRMENVLGIGWEDHFEGKALKGVCDELKGYLDTTGIYNEWLQQQLGAFDANKYNKFKDFLLLVDEEPHTGKRSLRVNFDDRQIVVFKEVRYLESLLTHMSTAHKSIPHTIRGQAKEAFNRYPTAMALQSALAGYNQAKSTIQRITPSQHQLHTQLLHQSSSASTGTASLSQLVSPAHAQAQIHTHSHAHAHSTPTPPLAPTSAPAQQHHPMTAVDYAAQVVHTRACLLQSHVSEVRDLIKEALGGSKRTKRWVKWESGDLNDWVQRLSAKVFTLQERTDDVISNLDKIDTYLHQLRSVDSFSHTDFSRTLEHIQTVVDEMQSKGLSHVALWVKDVDLKVESILHERVRAAILNWEKSFLASGLMARNSTATAGGGGSTVALQHPTDGMIMMGTKIDIDGVTVDISKDLNTLIPFEQTVHEILVQNQVLTLSPPLEQARFDWIHTYKRYVSVVGMLPRLVLNRYDVLGTKAQSAQETTYAGILSKIDAFTLKRPYKAIEKVLSGARLCVNNWLQYQALWDSSVSEVCNRLGKDIQKWQQLLTEIKAARSGIDQDEQEVAFGPVVINFRLVQHRINLKYETWQKEVQSRFGSLLSEEMKAARAEFVAQKDKLEAISLDSHTQTRDMIAGVEYILKIRNSLNSKQLLVNELENSEALLRKQRFQFPTDFMHATNVVGAFNDVKFICTKRAGQMDLHLPMLQNKIREEDAAAQSRVESLLSRWDKEKPVSGIGNPPEVLMALSMFTNEVAKLTDDLNRLRSAKEALDLPAPTETRLVYVVEECNGLKDAWTAVAPAADKLNAVLSLPIKDLNAIKVRKTLDEIAADLNALSGKVRSYACVDHLGATVRKNLTLQPFIRDLCTEALKERHWKLILAGLNIRPPEVCGVADLTVGRLYDHIQPNVHKKLIADTLSTAQGELAIEQFLKELKENWQTRELSLTSTSSSSQQQQQIPIRLVTQWDVLFSSLEDDLNSLASLKQSPYFRNVSEFSEQTQVWENKLTALRGIFDIWVEVQRKWVYLRGIFRSPDLKAQLPAQFSKFSGVDNDFTDLMKRVSSKPAVLDLLQVDNLLKRLERQETTMSVIQKALGEYLEKQRQIFPRFYFVNNEDLVEIIGNSNEPAKIVQHLSKMFAAVSTLDLQAPKVESSHAQGQVLFQAVSMGSKEGEVVPFHSAVSITVQVKEWLTVVETEMAATLLHLLEQAHAQIPGPAEDARVLAWMEAFPAQIMILASQVQWTASLETALGKQSSASSSLAATLQSIDARLKALSASVLLDLSSSTLRKKCEQLLTEMVHQRDVCRLLSANHVETRSDFQWLYHLRFYNNPTAGTGSGTNSALSIQMSNASFAYGFEYLGVCERLVETPLTARCYLTLTQALHMRLGGNPFGPAGTGKTESVKMLGTQLGRFVLVFNCDSSFDYAAMGRIFAGLCQVGAWGCFDEFNRLEERILSAVSQQILTIQRGLLMHQDSIELLGNSCRLNKDVGIFVTMNPGYAGRSNLPDNLKQLFRAVAMSVPDRKLIAQVMLFSQGIVSAEELAGKIVLLFTLCEEQLSRQGHYDFGLRALKSVLVGAGELKRKSVTQSSHLANSNSIESIETEVLIKSTCDSVLPKLVAEDISLFVSLLKAVFANCDLPHLQEACLFEAIKKVCQEEGLETSDKWVEKILQLKQIVDMRHGVMLVGPPGTGKTTVYQTLLKALSLVDGIKSEVHVIDPKTVKKEKLYGVLDPNTLEWTDGVFTKTLRRVVDAASATAPADAPNANTQSLTDKRYWIVFDGDVDPEWAENLNSVLDDNKILTLPSGDRLKLPPNVRIVMEVDTLKYATLATVSRCGMVWFAEDTISVEVALRHELQQLYRAGAAAGASGGSVSGTAATAQRKFVDILAPYYSVPLDGQTSTGASHEQSFVAQALRFAQQQQRAYHIMPPSTGRLLTTLHALMVSGLDRMHEYNEVNSSFPMSDTHMQSFAVKHLLVSVLWAFAGSQSSEQRLKFSEFLCETIGLGVELPPGKGKLSLVDMCVSMNDGGLWCEWASHVPRQEIESHKCVASDVIITTTDTVRHNELIKSWLRSHKPLLLCGPPGSGKTMTLMNVLDSLPEYILAPLNFSSTTTPELILKTFAQYCEISDSPEGLICQPHTQTYPSTHWLVIFCDELNLPEQDKYGTQTVIMFLRQLVERGGFFNHDCKWVTLKRIQFVGACNPPTDAGRVSLSERFLRHVPLLFVDYPTESSLYQIYHTFNHALLKLHPNLRGCVDSLTHAMVEFYLRNQAQFTPHAHIHPQYVYSPRELTRWVRSLYECLAGHDANNAHNNVITTEELVRVWAHEALRLFCDRLVTPAEQAWCNDAIDDVARKHFPQVDTHTVLQRPLLYSAWLKKAYQSVSAADLKLFVSARLKTFYEEALDVPLVVFDDVLEHVLRIDNVLRHPMGHMLLVGESGVGKTVLSRFVAWMNGLSVFQIKTNNKYTTLDFDEDLKGLFRRVCLEGEKVCFIFDESNVLSSAFLERMNALLASGEVPGLFEGDERTQLLSQFRESFNQREGQLLDVDDELWRQFTKLIQRNLHVIFTMNPASADFSNRCTASPALFNRCVVDWFGTWSVDALAQVGHEFTHTLDTSFTDYKPPNGSSSLSGGRAGSETESAADASSRMLYQVYDIISRSKAVDHQIEQQSLRAPQRRQQSQISGHADAVPTLREAVVTALMCMHKSVQSLAKKVAKATGREHFISPRDYLDVVNKFMSTEAEMRSQLEQQQGHIKTGLSKLMETQSQVNQLQQEMISKEAVLRTKDTEANNKLSQMVEKQNEAEQRKTVAQQLTLELQQQEIEINTRRASVEAELADAEPALLSAKHSVQNIRKAQLDEVRNFNKPPPMVKLTLEMVVCMIGEQTDDWDSIRKIIRKEDFIPTVVNFDPTLLTPKQVKTVQDNYLSHTEMDYASVDRASKACGPLYQWAASQIKYAVILKKIKPLRDEVQALVDQTAQLKEQQAAAVAQVEALENAIKVYKAEYAAAIRDTQTIKQEMDTVSTKVSRAQQLLASLNAEMVRWRDTSAGFDTQMSTLIGDCLLCAAFTTFGGIFDHKLRKFLFREWSDICESVGIPHQPDLNVVDYLSSPQQQNVWRGFGLPVDELAQQNAICLERFTRYPLIVDPAGQAGGFILRKYASQKIVQTSFLDTNFLKILASAVRFGTPLLITDIESMDPILNPVLNREYTHTGGRTLIRLGNEDIDFSPKFVCVLLTRTPSPKFAPDLCSRVTVVNFTVTPASLEAQALGLLMSIERPDVEHARTQILQQQAQQRLRIRELEDALLERISTTQGAILDDNLVVEQLTHIQSEAHTLQEDLAHTQQLLTQVQSVSVLFNGLARVISEVYFVLEKLAVVNPLYQFSLQFFLEVVESVLHAEQQSQAASELPAGLTMPTTPSKTPRAGVSDAGAAATNAYALSAKELKVLTEHANTHSLNFFKEISRRVCKSLQTNDKLMFMIRLCMIRTAQQGQGQGQGQGVGGPKQLTDNELDLLVKGAEHLFVGLGGSGSGGTDTTPNTTDGRLHKFKTLFSTQETQLSDYSAKQLFALSLLPSFADLHAHMMTHPEQWIRVLTEAEPELCVPSDWNSAQATTTSERQALLTVLIIKALRPERTLAALSRYVSVVFADWHQTHTSAESTAPASPRGRSSSTGAQGQPQALDEGWRSNLHTFHLPTLVSVDSVCVRPILIVCARGQDYSQKIDSLAQKSAKQLLQVSMGAAEGYASADKCLSLGIKTGAWVCLKNVHLCVDWLSNTLEKRIHQFAQTQRSATHTDFRLFLTCELGDAHANTLPSALLRVCEVCVCESSTGVRANISRFYNSIPTARMDKAPAERSRLYGLLAWLNAIVQERLCYVPLGWTKRYEFSETDATCALDVIDEWVDEIASGGVPGKLKAHVDPRELPWAALCTLLSQSLYGGRVDDSFDQNVLDSFVQSVFNPGSYAPNAVCVRDVSGQALLTLPDSLNRQAFDEWVANLSDTNSPVWLGLPAKAETERMKGVAVTVLSNLNSLLSDDNDDSEFESSKSSSSSNNSLKTVGELASRYMKALPELKDILCVDEKYSSDTNLNPIQRFMVREICKGRHLLAVIRQHVNNLQLFTSGTLKATNEMRGHMKCFLSGTIPQAWVSMYVCKQSQTLGQWLNDFIARMHALNRYVVALPPHVVVSQPSGSQSHNRSDHVVFWMGGMFLPETYIMATRQQTAQANGWSLDDMELTLDLIIKDGTVVSGVCEGIVIEGAHVDGDGVLQLSEELSHLLPMCSLNWRQIQPSHNPSTARAHSHILPLYLNDTRTTLLGEVKVTVSSDVSLQVWRQRGVALAIQNTKA